MQGGLVDETTYVLGRLYGFKDILRGRSYGSTELSWIGYTATWLGTAVGDITYQDSGMHR